MSDGTRYQEEFVRFDHKTYLAMAKAVGRSIDVYAYTNRIVIRRAAWWSGSVHADLAAIRRSMILGSTCRCWRGTVVP